MHVYERTLNEQKSSKILKNILKMYYYNILLYSVCSKHAAKVSEIQVTYKFKNNVDISKLMSRRILKKLDNVFLSPLWKRYFLLFPPISIYEDPTICTDTELSFAELYN